MGIARATAAILLLASGTGGAALAQEGAGRTAAPPMRGVATAPPMRGVTTAPMPTSPSRTYLPGANVLTPPNVPPQRIGPFAVRSTLSTSLSYDSNLEAEEDGDSAVVWAGSATTRLESTFLRHALGFDASVSTDHPLTGSGGSNLNWLVGADGRLDLTRRDRLDGRLAYAHTTPDPEDPQSEFEGDSDVVSFNGGYSRDFARFSAGLQVFAQRYEEEQSDGPRTVEVDGEDLSVESGDRISYGALLPFRYPVGQRLSVNVTPRWQRIDYDDERDDTRDINIFGVDLGASYLVDGGLTLSGSIGLQFRRKDDGSTEFKPGQGLAFNWSVTKPIGGRTSVDLLASRGLRASSVGDSDVRQVTTLVAGVTHMPSSTVRLRAQASYDSSDYSGISLEETTLAGTLSASWAITDVVSLFTSYRYSRGFSDIEDRDFSRHVTTIGLSATF